MTKRIALIAFLLVLACNTEKRRLTERLASLEQQHMTASRRVMQQKRAVTEAEEQLRGLRVDLATHNSETQTYIQQHQVAAACIYAARIQFGENNEYSQEIARGATVGNILCSIALLSQTFASEVRRVAERVREADERAKQLKAQIADLQKAVERHKAALRSDQSSVDELAAQMTDIRLRLGN